MVYIDTEGSFLLQRVVDIAAAAVRHCSLLVEDEDEEQGVAMKTFTVETILSDMFLVTDHFTVSHDQKSDVTVMSSDSSKL